MNWTTKDLDKLTARGMRVKIQTLHVSDINDFKAKPKIIPLNVLRDKAQAEFNTFIRTRDAQKGCISCQTYKVQQASHFFSAGLYTALRFNEDNVHGSCLQCNYFKHGNLIRYRQVLKKRIGPARLENLETSAKLNRVKKWSRFELEIIYKTYKEKNNLWKIKTMHL